MSRGSYCVVFETVESAVSEYLRSLESTPTTGIEGLVLTYQVDQHCENRLLITGAPGGYLQRV